MVSLPRSISFNLVITSIAALDTVPLLSLLVMLYTPQAGWIFLPSSVIPGLCSLFVESLETASEEEAVAIQYCVLVLGKSLVIPCNQVILPPGYKSSYMSLMKRLDPQSSSDLPSFVHKRRLNTEHNDLDSELPNPKRHCTLSASTPADTAMEPHISARDLSADVIRQQMNGDGEDEIEDEEEEAEEEEPVQEDEEQGDGNGNGLYQGRLRPRCAPNAGAPVQEPKNAARRPQGGAGSHESGEQPSNEEGNETTASQANRWEVADLPAPPSSYSQNLIVKLSNITSSDKAAAIQALVEALSKPASQEDLATHLDVTTSLEVCIQRCKRYDAKVHVDVFYRMVNLIQLALKLQEAKVTQNIGVDLVALKNGVSVNTLKGWRHKGQRFCCLAAGGTLYILIFLAALEMSQDVTKTVSDPIITVGRALRSPPDDPAGNLIKNIIIPHIAQIACDPKLSNLSVLAGDLDKILKFSDVIDADATLDTLATYAFKLPRRDHDSWHSVVAPNILPDVTSPTIISPTVLPSPSSEKWITNTTHVQCSFSLGKRKCSLSKSFTTEEHKAWTEVEREKGEAAPVAKSIDDLRDFMSSNQRLSTEDDSYIQCDPAMLSGDSLKLSDQEGQLIALLLTNMKEALGPSMLAFEDKIRSLYFRENMDDDSRRAAFTYFAQHYNMSYNRYGENGTGAPAEHHPDYLRKQGKTQVNFGQRLPHFSKDIMENMEEFQNLCDMLEDIGSYISANLKHHLPEIFDKLDAYTSVLPLLYNSPIHPFGGFLLGIGRAVICVSKKQV
ncbi:hypothetical protein DXG01_015316 [Tephrocybe rancida]|nr:hypothetical protein DXG01_015316 [Tephrocybe rancida]